MVRYFFNLAEGDGAEFGTWNLGSGLTVNGWAVQRWHQNLLGN